MISVSPIKLLLGIYKKSYLIKEFLSMMYQLQSRGNGKRNRDYFFPPLSPFLGGGMLGVCGIDRSSILGGGGTEAVDGILFSIHFELLLFIFVLLCY